MASAGQQTWKPQLECLVADFSAGSNFHIFGGNFGLFYRRFSKPPRTIKQSQFSCLAVSVLLIWWPGACRPTWLTTNLLGIVCCLLPRRKLCVWCWCFWNFVRRHSLQWDCAPPSKWTSCHRARMWGAAALPLRRATFDTVAVVHWIIAYACRHGHIRPSDIPVSFRMEVHESLSLFAVSS